MPNVYVRGKTVDVLVESSNKKIFVEVNNTNDDETRIRNMAYLATKYSNDIKVGQKYEQIDYFYQINLSRKSLSGKLEEEYEKWLNTWVSKAEKENTIRIAKNMLKMNYDIEAISKVTELSIEEIKKL